MALKSSDLVIDLFVQPCRFRKQPRKIVQLPPELVLDVSHFLSLRDLHNLSLHNLSMIDVPNSIYVHARSVVLRDVFDTGCRFMIRWCYNLCKRMNQKAKRMLRVTLDALLHPDRFQHRLRRIDIEVLSKYKRIHIYSRRLRFQFDSELGFGLSIDRLLKLDIHNAENVDDARIKLLAYNFSEVDKAQRRIYRTIALRHCVHFINSMNMLLLPPVLFVAFVTFIFCVITLHGFTSS